MHPNEHTYQAQVVWQGNRGDGTGSYETYGREYAVRIEGKPEIPGSADAAFRGDASRLNPEDLFLAAVSACHMLSYLALCARRRVRVVAYEDRARGTLKEDGRGGGRFESIELRPVVTLADPDQKEQALRLHERAHELCLIAASCSVPIRHAADVRP